MRSSSHAPESGLVFKISCAHPFDVVVEPMRREVVSNDVDLALFGFERDELSQERHELLSRMARTGLAQHLVFSAAERSIERGVPWRQYSKPWRSARPGKTGSTGSRRLSA